MATLKNRPQFSVIEVPAGAPAEALPAPAGNPIVLSAADGARIELFVLADDIIRVLVLPTGELRGPRTWSIAPGLEDVPLDGRDRRDMSGFEPTVFSATRDAQRLAIVEVMADMPEVEVKVISTDTCAGSVRIDQYSCRKPPP